MQPGPPGCTSTTPAPEDDDRQEAERKEIESKIPFFGHERAIHESGMPVLLSPATATWARPCPLSDPYCARRGVSISTDSTAARPSRRRLAPGVLFDTQFTT